MMFKKCLNSEKLYEFRKTLFFNDRGEWDKSDPFAVFAVYKA